MTDTGPGSGKDAAAVEAAVRAWFDRDGWRREPADLRVALQERGADEELICLLLDEGADRRRAEPPAPRPEQPARRNGRQLAPAPDTAPVPPQNLEAEESVLGAILLAGSLGDGGRTIEKTLEAGLQGGEFYRESHGWIYDAAVTMHARGDVVDAITLTEELDKQGRLDAVGGRVRLHELSALVPALSNVQHYVRIVRETAVFRAIIRVGGEASRIGWDRPGEAAELIGRVQELASGLDRGLPPSAQHAAHIQQGGGFMLDQSTAIVSLWGSTEQVAWAAGEGLMLVGPDGVGKTTLAQQLVLARIGIRDHVLGLPVEKDEQRILYIAADRPRQAQRSFRRMVAEEHRDLLNERLVVWVGHLPHTLDQNPGGLAQLIRQIGGIGTVVIDSLKDVALDLVKDDAGSRVNYALQAVIADGVEVIPLHHQRKGTEGNRKPDKLADVYGSRWLTAGMGSVISLWGDAGDPVVEFKHLKQPREELGPYNVLHDHDRGISTLDSPPDLGSIVYRTGHEGATALQVASILFSTDAPSRAQKAKASRQLERLAEKGRIVRIPGVSARPDRWVWNGATGEKPA